MHGIKWRFIQCAREVCCGLKNVNALFCVFNSTAFALQNLKQFTCFFSSFHCSCKCYLFAWRGVVCVNPLSLAVSAGHSTSVKESILFFCATRKVLFYVPPCFALVVGNQIQGGDGDCFVAVHVETVDRVFCAVY
jgi:hypothetical protein